MKVSRAGRKPARRRIAGRPPRMLARGRVAAAVQVMVGGSGVARMTAAKAVVITAEKDPDRVYPHLGALLDLLDCDHKIIRWNAIQIIARLAAVDGARRLDQRLDSYLDVMRGSSLISAANAIQGAARIARARPDLVDRILPALLRVENARYETAECRNVAIGHVLDALRAIGGAVLERRDVGDFISRQASNTRASVARRARAMKTPT